MRADEVIIVKVPWLEAASKSPAEYVKGQAFLSCVERFQGQRMVWHAVRTAEDHALEQAAKKIK